MDDLELIKQALRDMPCPEHNQEDDDAGACSCCDCEPKGAMCICPKQILEELK